MQNFVEHYFLQEKFTSDIRRAFTSNLFKKTTHGVDLKKFRKNLILSDYKNFERIKKSMQTEVANVLKRLNKKDKKHNKEDFGRIYVKNIFRGELDSGKELLEGNPIASVVYKLNNGGLVIFITTEDEYGNIRRYITANNKGNSFFRERMGTTLEQIAADSKGKETSKKKGLPIDTELNQMRSELEDEIDNESDIDMDDFETDEETPQEDQKFGILDISKEDFESLQNYWGTGKKSNVKGSLTPFKGKFTQERYYNKNGYTGYKYFDKKGHEIYLIDTGDGENAFIAFNSKETFDWANDLGLLSFWKTRGSPNQKIFWKNGTIEDNLE